MIFELITLQTQQHASAYDYSVRISKLGDDACEVDIYEMKDGIRYDVLYYKLYADELHGTAEITFHLINGTVKSKAFSIDFSDQIFQVIGLIRGIMERVYTYRKENQKSVDDSGN